jgi:predicted NBD/HSP70 family sugar kinase
MLPRAARGQHWLGANNAYRDWPVREQSEKATGLPMTVDNDANVAAL